MKIDVLDHRIRLNASALFIDRQSRYSSGKKSRAPNHIQIRELALKEFSSEFGRNAAAGREFDADSRPRAAFRATWGNVNFYDVRHELQHHLKGSVGTEFPSVSANGSLRTGAKPYVKVRLRATDDGAIYGPVLVGIQHNYVSTTPLSSPRMRALAESGPCRLSTHGCNVFDKRYNTANYSGPESGSFQYCRHYSTREWVWVLSARY